MWIGCVVPGRYAGAISTGSSVLQCLRWPWDSTAGRCARTGGRQGLSEAAVVPLVSFNCPLQAARVTFCLEKSFWDFSPIEQSYLTVVLPMSINTFLFNFWLHTVIFFVFDPETHTHITTLEGKGQRGSVLDTLELSGLLQQWRITHLRICYTTETSWLHDAVLNLSTSSGWNEPFQ